MKIRKFLARAFCSKKIRITTDLIILTASGYLAIKKIFDFSISEWLLENLFQAPLVSAYVVISAILLISAIFCKLIILFFDYFPPLSHDFVEPDEISDCLYRMNGEICSHLEKCSDANSPNIKTIHEQHGYELNLALITQSMATHIKKSISNIKIKKKGIFISLYAYNENSSALEYILHFDPKRDLVGTKFIKLDDEKFLDYECVKCISSANHTVYLLKADVEYSKGASNRCNSIRHYLGCKLYSGDTLYGFLNIEFHNDTLFSDEEEMQDFMEEHIYPFKLLMEYQFLKKSFFNTLKNFEANWRAA